MTNHGIRRVCCLLPDEQLVYYRPDLLAEYRAGFGAANVCSAAVKDYHLGDSDLLETMILPFLVESDQSRLPAVVHGSGGSGRTGHVLAAWLVRHRGLSVDDALTAVAETGRNPREAVGWGYASERQLRELLAGCASPKSHLGLQAASPSLGEAMQEPLSRCGPEELASAPNHRLAARCQYPAANRERLLRIG
jgi:hypothetical protein